MRKLTVTNVLFILLGNIVIGFAVALFRLAAVGADPYTTFLIGMQNVLGVSYGLTSVLCNIVFFVILFIFGRNYVGLGTIINMFGIGYFSDFFMWIFNMIGFMDLNIVSSYIVGALGIFTIALGVSIYITVNSGVSPYDGVGLVTEDLTNRRVKYAFARMVQDILAVLTGILLGAVFGVMTILAALCIGPLISFFNKHISIPIIERFN